ncbi:MAG: hypothetical protein AAF525_07805 [Pseudomonadota bacterium]
MIRVQRKLHLWAWLLLIPVLAVVLYLAAAEPTASVHTSMKPAIEGSALP